MVALKGGLPLEIKHLKELIEEKKFSLIQKELLELREADIAELLNEMEAKEVVLLFRLLPKNSASEVFVYLDVERQTEISELISEHELKEIIDELCFDDKIDLIEEVPANIVKKILKNTTTKERTLINQFLNYPEDSAGSLMTIEFVDLKKEMTVEKAMERIRRIGINKETIYTCYVTDTKRKLEGIVTLKELVLSDVDKTVEEIMTAEVISFNTHDDQESIVRKFKKYDFLTMPVVDLEDRLVGIITIDDVVDVIEEETTEDFQRMAAMEPSDEEYLSIPSYLLAKRRVVWLIILMFSAIVTEFITKTHSSLTTEFAMLVGVMPMLMSTGGNTGSQSSTLIIRGLTLGNIKFQDFFKIIAKEFKVGIIIGISLGTLNFLRIWLINNNLKLAIIVGLTLVGTALMAALIGGILPVIAKKIKLDPAIMATPLISTITDATTLLIFFTISAVVLL
ncbi:MAG: magnesium transporter [Firmicutes bacterium HGW-Firmicutes-7]|nr:MAG: magnesium transporter [Firmicutes bacterium HGW-Firmicutes-7]